MLDGAKFTVVSLESQVQVYSRNGKDLFDIVESTKPLLCSCAMK